VHKQDLDKETGEPIMPVTSMLEKLKESHFFKIGLVKNGWRMYDVFLVFNQGNENAMHQVR
jgi:hypothetical protein